MEVDLQPEVSDKEPRVAPTEQQHGLDSNSPSQPTNIYDPASSNLDSDKQNDPVAEEHTAPNSAERSKLPDTRVHTDWKPSAVAMAKCDICDKRGRGTVYMCQSCSQSVCYECCEQGRLGPGHVLDHKSVPWDLHLTSKQEKPKKKRAATRSATPRGGRGRGGRARGGVTKTRGSRAGSTLSVATREPTQELEETKALNRSSTSSILSDPPTDHGSPPPQSLVQQVREPEIREIREIRPLAPKPLSGLQPQQELPRILPRVAEMDAREPQYGRECLGSSSARPYQSPYLPMDHRYHPYDRPPPPPPTMHSSQYGFNEHYIPREEHQLPFRALAPREPVPQHGPPTSFETYRRPHHYPHLANYARKAYTHIPQPVSEPKSIAGCPYFEELRHDLLNSIQSIREELPGSRLETHLYTAISRAWNHGKLAHLRNVSVQYAFKMLVAISNAAFVQLNAPRNHSARQWLKDLEEQLVAEGVIVPLKDTLFRRGSTMAC